jgi:queuosine precursor transporter
MLVETDLSINEIARTGFEDAFYFSRCFRGIMHTPPRTYRRQRHMATRAMPPRCSKRIHHTCVHRLHAGQHPVTRMVRPHIINHAAGSITLRKEIKKMINELLWLVEIPVNFLLILLAYRLFGKKGLFLWIPVSVIVANIQVVMALRLFGLSATLGNVSYAASFLVTDILSEKYGKQEARKAVLMGLFCLVAATILFQLTLLFRPLPGDAFASEVHSALGTIFGLLPRIALGSLTAYLISQWHDVWALISGASVSPQQLWIRNNFSTMVSQLIDSVVFVSSHLPAYIPPVPVRNLHHNLCPEIPCGRRRHAISLLGPPDPPRRNAHQPLIPRT